MWSLLFGFMGFGNPLCALLRFPLMIMGIVGAVFAICGCVRCFRCAFKCRLRDCSCIKQVLLFTGHDEFADQEIMVLVHEAMFDHKDNKMSSFVKVTAGDHVVKTDPNSRGIYQQPLHITIEQGTQVLAIDLLDTYNNLLASLRLDVMDHILKAKNLQPELVYAMKQRGKGIRNPRIKLTMVVNMGEDAEQGLLSGVGANVTSDVDILVRQQLDKAKRQNDKGEPRSELEVLKEACSGPLELFEGLGQTQKVYIAVQGPPASRRWGLGIWKDQDDYEAKNLPFQEVDLMKVQSIQADPTRHHVFVMHCFDTTRVRCSFTFRRVDRARDVWVEILHLLVIKARESRKDMKNNRKTSPQPEKKDSKRMWPFSFGSRTLHRDR